MSDLKNELNTALAKAQAVMKVAKKGTDNPFYKSKYADLAEIWHVAREPLTSNGLSVTQTLKFLEPIGWVMVTKLRHSSGQEEEGLYPVTPMKNDPQSFGSAVSYAKRYSLAAMVGAVSESEDDDAESAMDRTTKPIISQPVAPIKPASERSMAQLKRLHVIATKHNWGATELKQMLFTKFGLESTKDLSSEQYAEICDKILPAGPLSLNNDSDDGLF